MKHDKKTLAGITIGVIGVVAFTMWLAGSVIADKEAQYQARKEVVCPSFLSITRSARDTLIVMRNEPLCNSYVLDNLK